jgi:hypothetical protein
MVSGNVKARPSNLTMCLDESKWSFFLPSGDSTLADPGRQPTTETTVNLRVEGKTTTIFEGNVATCGHRVTTHSGGTHHCNGTNNDKNPCAGPTCTTALDDANKAANFGFDGQVVTLLTD